jgi:hypothetical protein
MADIPETPKPQVAESGEYENLMELADQNKAEAEANPDAFQSLFEVEETPINPDHWTEHWKGMPEYKQDDNGPWKTIKMHFRNEEDFNEFSKLTENNLSKKTKSAWYPKLEITKNALLRWIEDDDGDEDDTYNDEDENNEGWSNEELHYSDE